MFLVRQGILMIKFYFIRIISGSSGGSDEGAPMGLEGQRLSGECVNGLVVGSGPVACFMQNIDSSNQP